MNSPSHGLDAGPAMDRPYRAVIARAVRAVPPVSITVGAAAIVLGGSIPIALAVVAAGCLSLLPPLARGLPDAPRHVIAGWIGLLAMMVPALSADRDTFGLAAVSSVALILFSRLISVDRIRRLVVAGILAIQVTGWIAIGHPFVGVWALLALGVVAVGTECLTSVHRAVTAGSEDRVRELSQERGSLIRLYEIASSIGASTSMAEALPDLLASIADAVGAQVCAVARHDSEEGTLTLLGPVWAHGMAVPVDDELVVPVVEGGFVCRAIKSSRAIRFGQITGGPFAAISESLHLDSGLVTPLRLEGKVSGLLIVGEPRNGEFSATCIDTLTEVAAPAGLVLTQVERHEAAALLAVRLKEIADMKTDLVSMVSHELRTPLTSVIGSLDILSRPDVSADEELAEELVTTASRQAHRLKRLIDDLLTVSRIDRGLIRPEPEPVSLTEVITEAVWVVGETNVAVSIPAELNATADPSHLSQVIINLVENASKYAPGSRIDVSAYPLAGGEVAVSVADHGPGVPISQRERIFERFVRLPGAHDASGTGLGLAIVSMLVENMGGRIQVLDTPGGGATFAVTLPGAESAPPRRTAA